MSRLPPAPDLDWTSEGAPRARGFDDVYFSRASGLEEARAVFLAGCGLPAAWARRERFTVAETGFGTGLNFLALWQLWRAHRPSPTARLHFVSFEGFPLQAEDAARALAAFPELAEFSGHLIRRWPHRARGVRRLDWPGEGISLTLHVDDIAASLPDADFSADAWFLDGFSPARNEAMWTEALYLHIARLSAPGARLASFTVAGAVRRGLSAAGFEVAKAPGFGSKRERLEARLAHPPERPADTHALRSPATLPQLVATIGAGIAGACAARALTDAGCTVTVFDAAPGPASGASGNPLALLMPRLDAADTVQARVMIDAYLAARAAYAGRPGTIETEVRQLPRDAGDRSRFEKLLADPPLPLEYLEALADGGLLHKRALILSPAELITDLLDGIETRFGAAPALDLKSRMVDGVSFDAIVLASGIALAEIAPWLGLEGRLGQVEHVAGLPHAPASAIASGHYALAAWDERLWGASFEAHPGGPAEINASARASNAEALERLSPWWLAQLRGAEIKSRAGVRATTRDRLPIGGPLPDHARVLEVFGNVRNGGEVAADAPLVEGVWLLGGLGSRGFAFAPWLASLVAAQICSAPAPASIAQRKSVSAMRFPLRGLKRRVE